MVADPDPPVRAIARAIDILVALTRGPLALGAVAEATSLTKGTVHRLLMTLGYQQLVIQDPGSGVYMLGPGMLRLADAATRGLGGLGMLARPIMKDLRERSGETVALHVRIGQWRICIDELPSEQAVRYMSGVGQTAPINTGSAGKVLLAFLDEVTLGTLLDRPRLAGVTDSTIIDRAKLCEELKLVRSQGWAESRGERVVGAVAVSAPVFDATGGVVASLSVLGPVGRLEPQLEGLREPVRKGAGTLSDVLGTLSSPEDSV